MKKIKSFMIMLLVAMVSLCLTGCQPDKDENDGGDTLDIGEVSIVGEWKMIYHKVYVNGDLAAAGEPDWGDGSLFWMFYDNGKVSMEGERYDYVVKNNKLYLLDYDYGEMCNYYEIETLTPSKLNLVNYANETLGGADFYRVIYMFERIKD